MATRTKRAPASPKRPVLTREAIVRAGLELADAEGIEAVSIRRVAAALGARPMSLYSQIERKDDLIDLMFDEIVAEALIDGEVPSDWKAALRLIAHRTRAALLAHPWVVDAIGRRSVPGPNTLRHIEQSVEAVASLDVEPVHARAALVAVDMYTLGHVTAELGEREARRRKGATPAEWRRLRKAYLDEAVESGAFPNIARFGSAAVPALDDQDELFETGLEWLLEGIAAGAA
jgi:AcrR family transcriptional regulator